MPAKEIYWAQRPIRKVVALFLAVEEWVVAPMRLLVVNSVETVWMLLVSVESIHNIIYVQEMQCILQLSMLSEKAKNSQTPVYKAI